MAEVYGWAKEFYEKHKDDPEFIAIGIAIEIFDNFYRKMEEKGISKEELAKKLGKSKAYVTKLLRGYYDNKLTIKDLVKLALAIGERPEKLSDLCRIFGDDEGTYKENEQEE